MDNDGYVSNGELFQVLKMMVGSNLKDTQLQQIVDKTIILYDKDNDTRIFIPGWLWKLRIKLCLSLYVINHILFMF